MYVKDKHNWPTRFWAKVDKSSGYCWEWTGCKDSNGYGFFSNPYGPKPKMVRAHRLAYQMSVSPIPVGMVIDHLCRNPKCVNPEHMEAVTHTENVLRGIGPTAVQFRSTHCPQGHLYDYAYPDGRRGCRKCINTKSNAWNKAHREQRNEYQRKWRLSHKSKIAQVL